MAILTRKSKNFIKAKVIFMKSCLPGQVGLMIRCILNNFIFSNAIFRVKGNLYSKTDFKGKISLGLQCLEHVVTFRGNWSPDFFISNEECDSLSTSYLQNSSSKQLISKEPKMSWIPIGSNTSSQIKGYCKQNEMSPQKANV